MTFSRRAVAWAALGLLSLSIAACVGAAPEARTARRRARTPAVSPFPSRDSLTKLADEPVPPTPVQNVGSAPEWNVVIDTSEAPSRAEARFAQTGAATDVFEQREHHQRNCVRHLGVDLVRHAVVQRLFYFGLRLPRPMARISASSRASSVPISGCSNWRSTVIA